MSIRRPASKDPHAKAFSRRHDTSMAHNEARWAWFNGLCLRFDNGDERERARAQRSSLQQLRLLNDRPGKSFSERTRLETGLAAAA